MNRCTRDRLTELVPPPRKPAEVDWPAAEASLGIAFPSGYRWLAETYGPGVFDDFLRLFVPGATALDLVRATAANTELNRCWLEGRHPPRFPWPLHPEPGGLVVWAETVDREALFWSTAGPPDEWPTVVESFESLATWRYDGPCEDLLLRLLEGTAAVPYIPHESFEDPHYFTPLEREEPATPTGALGSLARGVRRRLPF